ncbi:MULTISPECIES: CHASE domain-containing protein [unclassified Sphingopyxis]|jgi:CHASE1-domain containing sensor protein/two-component sensor histidine kinase|uniref:CHASE domain-containing protein n=1 Tax=unclassified Sphingopyxis TaxID=2614943 RepID=UPI0006BFD7D1|nr:MULTISPECIES: CHASE domain-containing protein [unclassified Sphingopyxis]USI76359.1 CHASE domain-containing protein [Sphingopyxis sp. USTB-05]GAO76906.1 sensor histidine kinase, putative [Sphingopyxis sp. C-1]
MRPSTWADRLLALLVRFVGLVILFATIVAASASFLYNQAEEADQAERVAAQFNMRLRDHVAILEGVRALYQSDAAASGPGIRAYLGALQPQVHSPGMEGIGIAAAMRAGAPAELEARLKENYGEDIKVWGETGQPVGFAVVLVEPYTPRRHVALGFDMYSEPVRREAMRRAWQTGRPAASGIVHLAQERAAKVKQPGFLIYLPVYARGMASDTAAGLTATAPGVRPIEAFIYAPFRINDMMKAILGPQLGQINGLEIRAGAGPSAPIVFRHGKMGWDAQEQMLRIADRQWTMRISYGRLLERLGRPLGIFLFGLALALLATQLHRVQQRRVGEAQALAEEKARHAEDRELMIGEMAHRMKNAFARIGALARITLRESATLEEFEARFDGRMRALSDAKQMLVTGAVDSVDLGRIVHRELELAGVSAEQLAAIAGPEVRLDDEGAQALSLAIHEFVTNSIKYGALAGKGRLTVGWHRDDGHIELDWVEADLAETPHIESESFGTRFIRTLIERQLKGSWERTAVDNRLAIVIRWPDNGIPN